MTQVFILKMMARLKLNGIGSVIKKGKFLIRVIAKVRGAEEVLQ
jgi:hypothetical protein